MEDYMKNVTLFSHPLIAHKITHEQTRNRSPKIVYLMINLIVLR